MKPTGVADGLEQDCRGAGGREVKMGDRDGLQRGWAEGGESR